MCFYDFMGVWIKHLRTQRAAVVRNIPLDLYNMLLPDDGCHPKDEQKEKDSRGIFRGF